tara:strand:- start:7090 stop:7293 length:204 start_codon:yes stop_codon:yes gene_type:complete
VNDVTLNISTRKKVMSITIDGDDIERQHNVLLNIIRDLEVIGGDPSKIKILDEILHLIGTVLDVSED